MSELPNESGSSKEGASPEPSADVSWFLDETTLMAELKLARPATPAPAIPGYTNLVEISRGGQGVVFAGIQTSTGRRVAVKLMHGGRLAGEAERQRFRREIALAASLRHPYVVRVHDSGQTVEGALYLVMEFVEGAPIDEAARQRPLAERLALLAKVCTAIQHAHQRGVIHRDLKPSNIRVDTDGSPRILDFGLARPTDESSLTGEGHFVGSLPWTSPEQVSGDASAVDSRCDVYALGIILYQLITNALPYDTSGNLRDAIDRITSADAPPLRTKVADAAEDLQAIVSTALAKAPADRYQSAGDLEQDLRSFLEGQPIRARRENLWRSMQRRVRRYRVAAVASAIVLAVVAAALVVSLRALHETTRARALAENRAREQAAVNRFLSRTLAAADPSNMGQDAKLVDLLDQSSSGIDAEFHDQPAAAAALHGTIGMTYRSLGRIDQAEQHINTQLQLARSAVGDAAPETLEAELNRALILRSRNKPEVAEAAARAVFDARLRSLGEAAPATLEAMNVLGILLLDLERQADAEQILRRCIELRIRTLGPDQPDIVESQLTLAVSLRLRGQAQEAETILASAVPAARRILGPEHPMTLVAENNRANLLLNALDRAAEAEPILRNVVAIQERKLGPNHIHTHGAMNNLASSLQRQGKNDEAEQIFRQCIERSESSAGPDAARTIVYKNNLASLLLDLKRPQEARPLLDAALGAATKTLGPDHSTTATLHQHLGKCLSMLGEYNSAADHFLSAFDRAVRASEQEDMKELAAMLADLYRASGQPDRASEWDQKR